MGWNRNAVMMMMMMMSGKHIEIKYQSTHSLHISISDFHVDKPEATTFIQQHTQKKQRENKELNETLKQ